MKRFLSTQLGTFLVLVFGTALSIGLIILAVNFIGVAVVLSIIVLSIFLWLLAGEMKDWGW